MMSKKRQIKHTNPDGSVVDVNIIGTDDLCIHYDVTIRRDVYIHTPCEIGEFTKIGDNAVLGPDVEIGEFTKIGSKVIIGKNTYIGDYVTIEDNVTVLGDARIGDDVRLCNGIIVHSGSIIGDSSVITAG